MWGYDPAADLSRVGDKMHLFDAIPTQPAREPNRDRGSHVLPEPDADWNTALEEGGRRRVLENYSARRRHSAQPDRRRMSSGNTADG